MSAEALERIEGLQLKIIEGQAAIAGGLHVRIGALEARVARAERRLRLFWWVLPTACAASAAAGALVALGV